MTASEGTILTIPKNSVLRNNKYVPRFVKTVRTVDLQKLKHVQALSVYSVMKSFL